MKKLIGLLLLSGIVLAVQVAGAAPHFREKNVLTTQQSSTKGKNGDKGNPRNTRGNQKGGKSSKSKAHWSRIKVNKVRR